MQYRHSYFLVYALCSSSARVCFPASIRRACHLSHRRACSLLANDGWREAIRHRCSLPQYRCELDQGKSPRWARSSRAGRATASLGQDHRRRAGQPQALGKIIAGGQGNRKPWARSSQAGRASPRVGQGHRGRAGQPQALGKIIAGGQGNRKPWARSSQADRATARDCP